MPISTQSSAPTSQKPTPSETPSSRSSASSGSAAPVAGASSATTPPAPVSAAGGPTRRCSACREHKPLTGKHYRPGFVETCRACEARPPAPPELPNANRSSAPVLADDSERRPPVPADPPADRPRLIVVLSDVHYETRWLPLWRGFLAWADEYGADVDDLVLNGDYLDFESASQHGGNARPPTLTEDIEEAKRGLRDLAARFPNARRVYMEGNHETRLPRFLAANAPTLAGSLDVPSLLALDAAGWRWVPTADQPKHSTFGALRLIHGHQVRGGGGVSVANTLLNKWWSSPGVTVSCGHFHRYSVAVRQAVEGNLNAISLPTMTTPAPGYTSGAHDHWSYGFVVFESWGAHLRHEPVLADAAGRFLYRGRVYGGGS